MTSVYGGNPSGFVGNHYGAPSKGILGSDIISISTIGTSGPGPLINDTLDPAKEYRWYFVTLPSAGDLKATEFGEFIFSGAPDGVYILNYRVVEDGALLSTVGILTLSIGSDVIACFCWFFSCY